MLWLRSASADNQDVLHILNKSGIRTADLWTQCLEPKWENYFSRYIQCTVTFLKTQMRTRGVFFALLVVGTLVQTVCSLKESKSPVPTLWESTQSIRHRKKARCGISVQPQTSWKHVLGSFPVNCGNPSFWFLFLILIGNVILLY